MTDERENARQGQFAGRQLIDAAFRELLGLCRGVLADRRVADQEVVALSRFLIANRSVLPEWPTVLLLDRLAAVFRDGVIDDDEREDLVRFLDEFVSGDPAQRLSSTLPLDEPPPHIEYTGRSFLLTGTFVFGTRKVVEAKILEEGGRLAASVGAADFLVIGATTTPSWKYSTHGRKIEEAVERRTTQARPRIVAEEHWVTSLTS